MNKSFLLYLLFLVISNQVFACEMSSAHRHTNPDSSEGGLVNSKAKVAATAYLAYGAKVCDSAWVDGNAKVLDQAIIKGNAWVREFSTVKDKAVIDEHAVLWGNQGFPVLVEGEAQIYGNAKILAGTTVSDLSRIYGNVSLKSSIVFNKGKVCENYVLSNQNLGGNYYCPEGSDIESIAKLRLDSVDTKKMNAFPEYLEFSLSEYSFSLEVSSYQIFVNDNLIPISELSINHNKIIINSAHYFRNGENDVLFKGRDSFDRTLYGSFTFVLGSGIKKMTIETLDHQIDPVMDFEVEFENDGGIYQADTSYIDGELTIYNIPESFVSSAVYLKGIGTESVVVERFESFDLIPLELVSTNLPVFIDNNVVVDNKLSTWNISHTDQIRFEQYSGKESFSIIPLENEIVEVSKTFKLKGDVRAIDLNLLLDSSGLNKSFGNHSQKIQIIFVSPEEKRIIVHDYSENDVFAFTDEEQAISKQMLTVSKKRAADANYTLIIRVFPVLHLSVASVPEGSWIRVWDIDLSKTMIEFSPQNLSPMNLRENKIITKNIGNERCDDSRFFLRNNRETLGILREEIRYLSAGETPMMPRFYENRIYGDLNITGIPISNISGIYLVGEQNGKEIFKEGLSKCSLRKFEDRRRAQPDSQVINISDEDSLVGHIFGISKHSLNEVQTYYSPNFVSVPLDGIISMKIVVEFITPIKGVFFKESSVMIKRILSSPDLNLLLSYNPNYKLEDYDLGEVGTIRTGGDKWIRPIYAKILEGIIRDSNRKAPENWMINDISKLNGGRFEGHDTTHDIGIDVDLVLMGRGFNLESKRTLNALERLLEGSKNFNEYIRDYIVTVPNYYKPKGPEDTSPLERSYSSLIEKRFQNRCIGDRIVRLPIEKGTGSVLRHIKTKHTDHTHLRFNKVGTASGPLKVVKKLPKNVSLNDFDFRYNDKNELIVRFRHGLKSKYADKRVLWRYQDKERFDDTQLNVSFGEVVLESGPIEEPEEKILKTNSGTRFIYIAFESINPSRPLDDHGWCIEKKAVIEI